MTQAWGLAGGSEERSERERGGPRPGIFLWLMGRPFARVEPTDEMMFMEKVVRKHPSFEAADAADDEHFRTLSGAEKLEHLLELIMPLDADEAVIQRSARVYPLAQQRAG